MDENFFGDRLRLLRNERDISAREMSLALGQNETYINKIENKQRIVSMSSFFKICDYLNVSPSDFFDEQIKNTAYKDDALLKKIQKLTAKQAEHIEYILDDILNS